MAESVKQELERKLESAMKALDEATVCMNRYKAEVGILQTRVSDLRFAIKAFDEVKTSLTPHNLNSDNMPINYADYEPN